MVKPALRPRFLAPGDKLGKFSLIRQIAVGGMAELYLARTMGIEGFEKLVVVKRILPQYADNPTFVNMFLAEARLSATLHHPNIAQVYDIGVEDGEYFFSMEYIHGEDLESLSASALENGVPVSLDAALTLAAGLCAGLHYAHEKAAPDGKPLNVVHRDVSPSNVIVSYDGAVKLVDFGIARAGNAKSSTKPGLKGKVAYMSPEQGKGTSGLDRRSDIYSVGTILYELTTGQLPFTAEHEYGVLEQIVSTDAPPPSRIVPSYPPALEAIVMKALARDPAQRFKSALELQGHLEDFAHETRLRVSPLVLVRLMSSLFPARLEEWDHARAQGGFFVEQHVVRTLIESGKAPDESSGVPQLPEPVAVVTRTPTPPPRTPTPAPATGPTRTPTPAPRARTQPPSATPGSVPILAIASASFDEATPVPVTSSQHDVTLRVRVPTPVPEQHDVTLRVRVPTPVPSHDETAFIRPPRRSRLPWYLAAVVAIGAIAAAVIVLSGGSPAESAASEAPLDVPVAKESSPPDPVEEPTAVETEPAVAEPAVAEPAVDEPAGTEPAVAEPAVAEPAVVEPPPQVDPTPTKAVAKKKPATKRPRPTVKRPTRKPEPTKKSEPKPKEPAWNEESPFMPVRTDKR